MTRPPGKIVVVVLELGQGSVVDVVIVTDGLVGWVAGGVLAADTPHPAVRTVKAPASTNALVEPCMAFLSDRRPDCLDVLTL